MRGVKPNRSKRIYSRACVFIIIINTFITTNQSFDLGYPAQWIHLAFDMKKNPLTWSHQHIEPTAEWLLGEIPTLRRWITLITWTLSMDWAPQLLLSLLVVYRYIYPPQNHRPWNVESRAPQWKLWFLSPGYASPLSLTSWFGWDASNIFLSICRGGQSI